MPQILLIIFYSAVFCLLIVKTSFFRLKELSIPFICGAFVLKILVGILYGAIHSHYFNGGDTFLYFKSISQISATFFEYPAYYFQSWVGMKPSIPEGSGVFEYPDWKYIRRDFGTYLLVHLHTIPQLLSFGYYNVHIVFVAFLSVIASINFFRALHQAISIPKTLLIFSCFFMPSLLFWTSGLHKDVWVYFGISMLLLGLSNFSLRKTNYWQIFSGLIIIGLFRYYLIPMLIPGILAFVWSFSSKKPTHLYKFLTTYASFFLLLLLTEILGLYPLLEVLSMRQQEFLSETGNSGIEGVEPFFPTFFGVLQQLPSAVVNVGFRPFIWDCKDILQYIAALEILAFWILVFFTLPYRFSMRNANPMSYFLFFYAFVNMLLIGLLVSNVGTIVRYRAIALAMLSVVVLQAFNYIRIGIKNRTNPNSSKPLSSKKRATVNSQT